MSETIAEYYDNKQKISDLEKKLASQIAMKHKAMKSRDKAYEGKIRTVNVLLKLCFSGRIDLTIDEIAEVCFITKKSVIEARSRLLNGR